MLNIEMLRDDREENYKVWFERWWKKADIERKVINANACGSTKLVMSLNDLDDYTRGRMRDDLFFKCLRKKLPGFQIRYEYRQALLGNYRCSLVIDWSGDEFEDRDDMDG